MFFQFGINRNIFIGECGMENGKNYITIMIDSLYKKITILDKISEENEKQRILIEKQDMELEDLEPLLEKKQEYIDKLNELDDGFQSVYDRIKIELKKYPEQYKEEIKEMKKLISQITGKSMVIQTEEERNKQTIQERFGKIRRQIRQTKNTNKAVTNYYNNMNNLTNIEAQFMDRKK